jgi:hypothetical protein
MSTSATLARLAFAAVFAACVPACAASEDEDEPVGESTEEVRAPESDGFAFAQSRDEKEKAVPVTSRGDAWKTIYSVRLDGLGKAERVAVRGEVQLTRCHSSDVEKGTPCKSALGDNADLAYEAKIVVGGAANDANGDRVAPAVSVKCSHFDHHCALAIDESVVTGLAGTKFVKLIVAAKGDGKVMIVDEGHGGLAVTRIGKDAARAGKSFTARRESDKPMDSDASDLRQANGLPGRKSHVTFRQRIDDARPGDLLDVDARIIAITKSGGSRPGGCSGAREPLITHQVFLSTGMDAEGTKIGTLTAKNGTNCRLDARCGYDKSGAASVPKNHPPGKPVYVSVVSSGGRSCAGSGDEWRIDGDSKMTVRRRR